MEASGAEAGPAQDCTSTSFDVRFAREQIGLERFTASGRSNRDWTRSSMPHVSLSASDAVILEMANFARSFLQASASTFFWISPEGLVDSYYTIGRRITGWEQEYIDGVQHLDPLDPHKMLRNSVDHALFSAERLKCSDQDIQRYTSYQQKFSVVDELELIMRLDGIPVAGLSVLKLTGDPAFSEVGLNYDALVKYFSYNLSMHSGIRGNRVRKRLSIRSGLTSRAIAVCEWIGRGASNAAIGELREIGLATVKTHVFNIFNKLGVDSRGGVIAFCSTL